MHRKPRRANWWFEGLIQLQPANDGALNAELFSKTDTNVSVAVDRLSNSVFVYIAGI